MGTSVSRVMLAHIRTILAALAALTLALCLAPATVLADEPVAGGFTPPEGENDARSASPNSAEAATPNSALQAADAGNSILASTLAGQSASILSADVSLDTPEPLIGSFTVDGLTYAVGPDGLTLVSVDSSVASDGFVSIPASVTYTTTYVVTSIAPYAFYLSGITQVELPTSITSVDDRAFRSSDVERVDVAAENPNLASFDGALYSADTSCLLLIPEGRAGAVLLPETAERVQASKFSHCSLVDAISVEEGGAAYASWDGLLYDASGTTLLRVPVGAVEITIRDGCTTIAAGALEGCANLERIHAPSSVTSISPDVFTSIPTVALPAQSALRNDANSSVASALADQSSTSADSIPQLTAMVALAFSEDGMLEVNPDAIEVVLPEDSDAAVWEAVGFTQYVREAREEISASIANLAQSSTAYAVWSLYVDANGGVLEGVQNWPGSTPALSISYNGNYSLFSEDASVSWTNNSILYELRVYRKGYSLVSWTGTRTVLRSSNDFLSKVENATYTTNWAVNTYPIAYELDGGAVKGENPSSYRVDTPSFTLKNPIKAGYLFAGWEGVYAAESATGGDRWLDGISTIAGQEIEIADPLNVVVEADSETGGRKYTARWVPIDISFDTSSEPDDEDYPGGEKPSISAPDSVDDEGRIEISDPKRPGYVFEGWVIPNADGTEAIDQELVYQDDDGKWYVDASKLPDYAGDDGRVELTARWTSVISVDVPQSVTFYADTVTQNQGSREGAASSAFGQNKVANQSQVDLRVVGLESEAVETTDTTLGADSILKKAEAATPSTSASKLLSLYPSTKQWTVDELQDPEAVGGTKAGNAVDFDLDDILLEASFPSDAFTIEAGKTLNMGYRLNLSETGQQLDYDKLSTLEDGQSAAIANVSYCFAADYEPVFWTTDDDGLTRAEVAIKADAEKIAAGDAATTEKYTRWMNADHRFYVKWYDQGKTEAQDPEAATVYEVRIIGINHDSKADGSGKAGLTFQFVNCLKDKYRVNASDVTTGAWPVSEVRARMNPGTQSVISGSDNNAIWVQVPQRLASAISPVSKVCWTGSTYTDSRTTTVADSLFLPGEVEVRKIATYPNYTSMYYNRTIAYEGSLYAFFQDAPNGYDAWNGTQKRLGDSGSYFYWWVRSRSSNSANMAKAFMVIGPNGSSSHADPASSLFGVSPAFCL